MKATMMKHLAMVVACAGFGMLTAASAQAATINFNIAGVDLLYSGPSGHIRDLSPADNSNGGDENANEADKVDGTVIRLDAAIVEQYMSSDAIYGDLLVKGLPNSMARPTPVTAAVSDNTEGMDTHTFGFEWFLNDGMSLESSLQLDFDSLNVLLIDNGTMFPTLTLTGSTTVFEQFNLPGGLQFATGTPIRFTYTAENTSTVPVTGTPITQLFAMDGVVSISGEAVPEPASALLLLGTMGSLIGAMRYRLG